jgi:hypothetical protein
MHLLDRLRRRREPTAKVRTDCPRFVAIACCDGEVFHATRDGICHDGSTSNPGGISVMMAFGGCRTGSIITVEPGSDLVCTDPVALFQ